MCHIPLSKHASRRMQQRSIPPMVLEWLLDYGEEEYDGRGAILRYFGRRSVKRLERLQGRPLMRQMKGYQRAYAVASCNDATLITVGWRTKKIRRS